jgi:hypothetical protein
MSGATVNDNGADGGVVRFARKTISTAERGSLLYSASPDSHYVGGCLVEEKVGGYWYPVINRIPTKPLGRNWRISNGIFRFGPDPTDGYFLMEAWDPTALAWYGTKITDASISGTTISRKGELGIPLGRSSGGEPAIIENSLNSAVIRMDVSNGGYVQFSVRPMISGAEIIVKKPADITGVVAAAQQLDGLCFAANVACSAIPTSAAGIRTTSVDANGIMWMFACPDAITTGTNGLTLGGFAFAGAKITRHFFAGQVRDGTSGFTGAAELARFLASSWTKTRMLVR